MLKTKIFIVTVLLLAITELHQAEARVDVYKRLNNFSAQKVLFYRHYSFENGRLLYALCDESPHEYKCKVVQERMPFENATYTCNVTLGLKGGKAYLSSLIVIAFGEDKAILTWADGKTVTRNKFVTLHLPECRQSKQFQLSDPNAKYIDGNNLKWVRNHQIATFNDTYDVFLRDYIMCGLKKLCRLTIDSEGNVIQKPTPYMDNYPYEVTSIYSAAENSSAKGYVYMNFLRDWSTFILVQPDKSEKQLMRFRRNDIAHTISTAYNTIGICARTIFGSDTQCGQFDLNGQLKLATNLTNENVKLQPIQMYNLPEGGFFLLFVEFKECDYSYCWLAATGYNLMKINAAGEKVGDLRFEGYTEAKGSETTHIWKKENEEGYCMWIFRNESLIVNCFTGDDFKLDNQEIPSVSIINK